MNWRLEKAYKKAKTKPFRVIEIVGFVRASISKAGIGIARMLVRGSSN